MRIGRVVLKSLGVFRSNVVSKVEPWVLGVSNEGKTPFINVFLSKVVLERRNS